MGKKVEVTAPALNGGRLKNLEFPAGTDQKYKQPAGAYRKEYGF